MFIIQSFELKMRKAREKRSTTSSCYSSLNIPILQECNRQNLIDLNKIIALCEFDFSVILFRFNFKFILIAC
jgi:hypothetical protein